jgi:hypothetical protein
VPLEKAICDLMHAVTGVETWFGAQPQGNDDEPARLPVVIVNRPDSTWLATFCGTDGDLALATMRIDFWHTTAEGARRLADKGRVAMIGLTDDKGPLAPILGSEVSYYEPMARAWRVMQAWQVPDYQPVLPP